MPRENVPARRRAADDIPHDVEYFGYPPASDAVALGEAEQMVVRAASTVHGAHLKDSADLGERPAQLAVAAPVDGDVSAGRQVEAEDQPHRRGFAGSVRAEEPGHATGQHVEAQRVDGLHLPEPLGQLPHLDHASMMLAGNRPADP
jgi:hypothetical protein